MKVFHAYFIEAGTGESRHESAESMAALQVKVYGKAYGPAGTVQYWTTENNATETKES